MMLSKFFQIEFANPAIKAINEIQRIREASNAASLNLNLRHNIVLQYPMPYGNDRVYLEVKIPTEKYEDFKVGYQLRGITNYLLKQYPVYEKYILGNRLLVYTEIAKPSGEEYVFSINDRLEAIADFAHLLERSDETSLAQIHSILAILKEAR